MSQERYSDRWTVGQWTFYRIEGHGFSVGEPLYGYGPAGAVRSDGRPQTGEWYNTLEHAMVAAVAEKYTGARGAGGTGVGTAADWFMRMIGADQLVALEDGIAEGSLRSARAGVEATNIPLATEAGLSAAERARRMSREARWTLDELRSGGIVLARLNDGR